MTESGLEEKKFYIVGSNSLFTKYKKSDKELTVYLTDGTRLSGKIRYYDDYSIKLVMSDGSITVPIHNIVNYECDRFLMENEVDGITFSRITEDVIKALEDKINTEMLKTILDKDFTDKKLKKKLTKLNFSQEDIDLILNSVVRAEKVSRGVPKSSGKEKEQLFKYKHDNELLYFRLEDGFEIKGRLEWFLDHIYCVKSDGEDKLYFITKRHILYYKKLDPPEPERTERGTVKILKSDKGFGFITSQGGDVFFHFSELRDKPEALGPGKKVAFAATESKKGKVAINIKLLTE